MATISDVLRALDARFPFGRAESWDKVGLQIGAAGAPVTGVYVAYEVTESLISASSGHEAVVVYHPLLFRPLENLNFANHTARLAARLIASGQNLISVHTALDGAEPPGALGDALANRLGLRDVALLKPSGAGKLVKIVTFVPDEALAHVSEALWAAGAGQIGRYDRASFRTRGVGTFRPLEGANPYLGQTGQTEEAGEWRLEVIVPEGAWKRVVGALIDAHPYEEVAYDVVPLLNGVSGGGYGPARLGHIAPVALDEFARSVSASLGAPGARLVRRRGAEGADLVRSVACSPGSGASLIEAAAAAGADCLVTGDIKHHDALKAMELGLNVLDVSHAATERAAVPLLADALRALHGVTVTAGPTDTNPFETVPRHFAG